MTILERINDKINDLSQNSQDELKRTLDILNIINLSIDALSNEQKLKEFDFTIAINLVNKKSFGIVDLEKIMQEIKNLLVAKYDYKQSYLVLNEDYQKAIKGFRERLGYLKEEFERKKEEQEEVKIDEKILENLLDLKTLLEGKGRRKYYTYEMIESLFEVFDYDSFTYQDIEEFIKELSVSKNIKGKIIEEEKKDINDVIKLFNEFLGDKIQDSLLKKYQNEICSRIDLANAKNILKFFKDNNIINKFSTSMLLSIVIYGRYEYISDFYYEKVLPKNDKLKELYFENAMNGVWINEKSTKRRYNTNTKKSSSKESENKLYVSISDVCDDDVWENIRLLKENEDILSEKYDLSNIDYLWVITKPVWLIKKNLELFRLFNISDIKLSALVQNDLEDKIHFAIELGLLNTPRTYVFREIEKTVPRYHEFMLNGKRKKNFDRSILNYFSRYTSEIGKVSYFEYIYWFYKMQRSGKEEFYKDFFSSFKAGNRNRVDEDTPSEISNSETMERLIDDNFVINYFDALIPNYDIYSSVIRNYKQSEKGDIVNPYYDERVLNDDMVSKLEEHVAIDIYSDSDEIRKVQNSYVYNFDTNIISRYKVLRNLSILKHQYGYLNTDMILTSVVYNSYITKDTFDKISASIKEDVIVR